MSVAGKWQISMDTPIGTQKFTWDLQPAGAAWKGTMNASNGASELSNLQVSGSNVGCSAKVSTPLGQVDVTFEGAVTGDKIGGTCRTQFGNFQFSGDRA
ncbi:MAG TPA: hypothetical protein VGQ22_12030 [Steroidobacteraceae bacterium]|jgi:hypothetical protein|nr:hypothetical protein [Steroidobacteraceae bacterium]